MPMPPQLARAHRPRPAKSQRPILEQLPSISANDLGISGLDTCRTYVYPHIGLRYPWLSGLRLSTDAAEFHLASPIRGKPSRVQIVPLKHIRTGFGNRHCHRHAFKCTCGRAVIRLYLHEHKLACRWCHKTRYSSQAIAARNRPALQSIRLESFLRDRPKLRHDVRRRLEQRLGQAIMKAQGRYSTRARPA
jgi:hypothetical protein